MSERSITVRVSVTTDDLTGVTECVVGQTREYNGFRQLARVETTAEFTNEELERCALLAGSLVKLAMAKLGTGRLLR